MAKSSRRIALYELVNKARFKSAQQKALSSIGQKVEQTAASSAWPKVEPISDVGELGRAEKTEPVVKPCAAWSTRPKAVRFYPDRMELCFSWQVAIIGLLALVAMFAGLFQTRSDLFVEKDRSEKSSTDNDVGGKNYAAVQDR